MSTKKSYSLDIFTLMGKIDKGNFHIWEELAEEEKKGFSALIIMRWMSGTSDVRQIVFLNELLNQVLFDIGKHPELQLKLLTVSSSKQPKRYKFNKISSGKKKIKGLEVIKKYYNYSTREATDVAPLLKKENIIEMAEELGYQQDEIKKLKAELR